jgi:TPR repeat protein/uncharacterized caspase-like protein
MRRLATCLAAALALAGPAEARRSAVVIGNASYDHTPLANSARDAQLVADRLESIGFDVLRHYDLDHAALSGLPARIAAHLDGAEIGLVYYAGHAVQIDGRSYLLPVDLGALDLATIEAKRVALRDVVASALDGAQDMLRLFIVDACRTDPFSALDRRVARGLDTTWAPETGVAAPDTLIAYAASSGQLASDGPPGQNGPYAIALDRALSQPGLVLPDVIRQVTRQVSAATGSKQVPWVSGAVRHEHWLNTGEAQDLLRTLAAEPASLDAVVWYFVATSITPLEIRRFVQQFPDSAHREAAFDRLEDLRGQLRAPVPEPVPQTGAAPEAEVKPSFEIPAHLFRPDWSAMPDIAGGLAARMTECDRLAADGLDPNRIAPGLRPSQMNLHQAAQACAYAILARPEEPRFAHQLGRVLQAAELHDWSRHFYASAAERGYTTSLVNLGYVHRQGLGVAQDDALAHRYYMEAALRGNLRARTNVGTDFLHGEGVAEHSAVEAVQWFRLASESGWAPAQNALATRYLRGEGVPADPAAAAALYELAALGGLREAMNNLGRLYLSGEGVPQDRAEAHLWLRLAIAEGDPFAPFTLARDLLAGGEGAAEPGRVLDLLKLAWHRGNDRAILELAWVHERGEIVPRDLEAALAAAYRAELADVPKAVETVSRLRDRLAPDTAGRITQEVAAEQALNGR